jgi:hypothetical protein
MNSWGAVAGQAALLARTLSSAQETTVLLSVVVKVPACVAVLLANRAETSNPQRNAVASVTTTCRVWGVPGV